MLIFASFSQNEYYESYANNMITGEANTYIILMELLSLFCLFSLKTKYINENVKIKQIYMMLPLITMFVPLIALNGSLIRIGKYFTLYMMLLVPKGVDSMFRLDNRRWVYMILISILFINAITSNFRYYFVWQDPFI